MGTSTDTHHHHLSACRLAPAAVCRQGLVCRDHSEFFGVPCSVTRPAHSDLTTLNNVISASSLFSLACPSLALLSSLLCDVFGVEALALAVVPFCARLLKGGADARLCLRSRLPLIRRVQVELRQR